jgi:hypothetical protein
LSKDAESPVTLVAFGKVIISEDAVLKLVASTLTAGITTTSEARTEITAKDKKTILFILFP